MGELASASEALGDATKEPALSCGHCLKFSYLEQESRVAITKRVPNILGWALVLRTNHIIQACITKAPEYGFKQSTWAGWDPACPMGPWQAIPSQQASPSEIQKCN